MKEKDQNNDLNEFDELSCDDVDDTNVCINDNEEIMGSKGLISFFKDKELSNPNVRAFITNLREKYQINDDISYILLDINDAYEEKYYCNLKTILKKITLFVIAQ